MKKTIEQWLKEGLTPEQFENAKGHQLNTSWNTEYRSLSSAILNGFNWNNMPEGSYFWCEFHDNLVTKGL